MMGALRRSTTLSAGLAAVALAAAACGGGGGGGTGSQGPIKIGVPVPLSGDSASAGQDILHGAQLAAKDINAKGGILGGRKIQVIGQDDACSAQTGAQAAAKLVEQGVAAAAGGYCSTAAIPELNTFHRNQIPYVMDASTNPQLTEMGFKEAFRTIGRDDNQGKFAASFFTDFLHAKRVAVLHDNTTYAKGLADATANEVKAMGGTVVYLNALTPGQSDYTPVLTSVAQTNPEVLYYTGYFAEGGLLIKQAKQLGLKFQLMGGDANNDPTLLKTAGPAAEGFMLTTAPLAQFLAGAKGFVDGYRQAYGQQPGAYSVYEYDAVQAVAKAIDAGKSTKPADVVTNLHKLTPFEGVTGSVSFDAKGDRVNLSYIVVRVKGGQFTAYKRFQNGQWVDVPPA